MKAGVIYKDEAHPEAITKPTTAELAPHPATAQSSF